MLRRAQALQARGLSYAAIGAVLAEDYDLPANVHGQSVRDAFRRHGVEKHLGRAPLQLSRPVGGNSPFGSDLLEAA